MEKFYLGVDIGTDSVGMACTDENYNLLRAKGKDMWAVRLFDEAKDASERRLKRTARRRLQRRRQRIDFLQGVFAPFMEDNKFFLRLNNSAFYEEDKSSELKTKFSLFADENYTDIDFYSQYPTIFHLRNELIKRPHEDLRLYYLALHHIVKYRGHFLFEGETENSGRDLYILFDDFNAAAGQIDGANIVLHSQNQNSVDEFKALLLSSASLNEKKKKMSDIFDLKTVEQKEVVALIIGATAKTGIIFGEEYKEKYKDEKLSFKGLTEEAFEEKREIFDDEHFAVIECARAIYNYITFEKVLNGKEYISESMIELYKKHGKDLRLLKVFIKNNYDKDAYKKVFRSINEKANYVNYIGHVKKNNEKCFVKKCNDVNEFYKFIKAIVNTCKTDSEEKNYILSEIENGTFLPKILNSDNGLFPHQINGIELDAILSMLCRSHPEFAIKDESGFSPAEKIKKIFLFKIPYYVGPLNTFHSNEKNGNSWMVRKAQGKITPWNFDDMVDKSASNEKFIRRMTNKCTYLHNQDVIPKGSMYYQAFDTLNQINKLTIGSVPISVEIKKEIFNNVYLANKKVTAKQIKDYLVCSGKYTVAEMKDLPLGGFDAVAGLKANMSSYFTFKSKFGNLVDKRPEIFEDIILWHTLNTDKSIVEESILNKYGNVDVIRENIKFLKGMTAFKDFGNFSKKFLCGISGGIENGTGKIYTILERLYHTNYNLNQVLNLGEYTFNEAIKNENGYEENEEITYDDVAELYIAPMVRRGVWQTLKMINEYVDAIGRAPDKIFIEVTRHDGKKGERKESRKTKILDLYNGIGNDCADIDKLLFELNQKSDANLRQERLYLYFLQLGRCAYTGERISLENLSTDLYDVDHIVPQSIIKDDSLDNKVLVKREKNKEKTDIYPLPYGFTNQQSFWKLLKSKGLISDSKYAKLMRTKELGVDDFNDFVNRQLVVTNQSVKAVANLLERKYKSQGTKVVYSKAKNVDDFKQNNKIYKCRETNDLHHARDAYFNIVVGNVYDTKFTNAFAYFKKKPDDFWRRYSLKFLFNHPIEGAWKGREDIDRIKKIAAKTSMSVTRFSYVNKGKFYDETVYGKGDSGIVAPRKDSFPYNEIQKYGGFSSLTTAYFAIVQSLDKKGRTIKTIEAIPVLIDYKAKNDNQKILDYLTNKGLVQPQIIVPKLKVKSLVSINGFKVWLAGVFGDRILIHNAQQWFTNQDMDLYVKNLAKLCEWERNGKISLENREKESFDMVSNKNETTLTITKEKNIDTYNALLEQLRKPMYSELSAAKTFANTIEKQKNKFEECSTLNQAKVLLQIIRFLKCNAENADLSILNAGATCGKLNIGKKITDVEFCIIHQSPCGLTERIQKL